MKVKCWRLFRHAPHDARISVISLPYFFDERRARKHVVMPSRSWNADDGTRLLQVDYTRCYFSYFLSLSAARIKIYLWLAVRLVKLLITSMFVCDTYIIVFWNIKRTCIMFVKKYNFLSLNIMQFTYLPHYMRNKKLKKKKVKNFFSFVMICLR